MLELFTRSTCTKCAVLVKKLENAGIPFVKRVIDLDPEAETDAIMLGIRQIPSLRENNVPVSINIVLRF